jgi:hypothetical protein
MSAQPKTNKKEEVHTIAALIQWSFDKEQPSHFNQYVMITVNRSCQLVKTLSSYKDVQG